MAKRSPTLATLLAVVMVSSISLAFANVPSLSDAVDKVFSSFHIAQVSLSREAPGPVEAMRAYTFQSALLRPQGENYVIISDQIDPSYVGALNSFAQTHQAKFIRLKNLRDLTTNAAARAELEKSLKEAHAKFVAISPRFENFSETVVLAIWQVLSDIGGGKIDVYPGFLVAPDAQSFATLLSHSAENKSYKIAELKAVLMAQSTGQSAGGVRAVEKAALFRDLFGTLGAESSGLVIRSATAPDERFPNVGSLGTLDVTNGQLIRELPSNVKQAIADSHLLIMFGHGFPGMTCSLQVSSFRPVSLNNAVVLCGSCFSCVPKVSDISGSIGAREPFFCRAIIDGARLFYGHMHTNGGFPEMFVVFNALMNGETCGQAYQRLLNCLIAETNLGPLPILPPPANIANPKAITRRNELLYMLIGDPAEKPISI